MSSKGSILTANITGVQILGIVKYLVQVFSVEITLNAEKLTN